MLRVSKAIVSANRPIGLHWAASYGLVIVLFSCQKETTMVVRSSETLPPAVPQVNTDPQSSSSGEPSDKSTKARGAPVEMPEALGTPRSYFQTRSVIKLPVEIFDLQPGDKIALTQKDSNTNLLTTALPTGFSALLDSKNTHYFLEQREFALGTSPQVGDSLGYDLIIRLIPSILCSEGKLNYGKNQLRLLLEGANEDKEANHPITIRDFPYFSLGTAVFAQGEMKQRIDRYQGRASWVASPVVRSTTVDLTVGTIGITNR